MGIQENLTKRNFRNVVGMIEHAGGNAKQLTIKKGTPLTWDYNNGVTVVYDENGDPWLHRGSTKISDKFVRGAYVPMSNDGGWGIRNLFPTLEENREYIFQSYCTTDEFLQQLNAAKLDPEPVKFAKSIDAVIVGTCSAGFPTGYNHTTKDDAHTPNPPFFERFPGFKDAKVIVLIAECCGGYTDGFVRKLNAMYPHIEEWIVPWVSDYCERPTAKKVFNDLKRLKVIVPVKA